MFEKLARVTLWATRGLNKPVEGNRRGIALIIVMATVAILSTSVVEFAYQTNVNVFIAANARDEMKASYMAKSGMNLAVLMLHFQVREGRGAAWAPVDDALTSVDEPLLVQVDEGMAHRATRAGVKGEGLSTPVATDAQAAVLLSYTAS